MITCDWSSDVCSSDLGTVVCEPVDRFRVDVPADTLGPVLSALARLGAAPEVPSTWGSWCTLEGRGPAARVQALRRQLAGLTRGEAVLESAFDGYEPVTGAIPTRPRPA
jgi:ribosomal protection tetracycline resistance protein